MPATHTRYAWSCTLVVALLAACSSDESSPGPTGGTAGAAAGGSTTTSTGAPGGTGGSGAAGSGGAPGGAGQGGSAGAAAQLPYDCPPGLDPCPAFPAAHWDELSPDEVGLDATKLAEFASAAGSQGVVTRYGYLVHHWGSLTSKFGWASASKPVFSTLLLFAVQEGLVTSVDEPVAAHGWSLRAEDQTMSFRHLADMTSGYALPEAPGAAWGYNDYGIKLYALTLFERVFDDGSADDIARQPQRLGPLQFEDGDVFSLVAGSPRVTTTPRDFARIGWFWANHGYWDGQQLLDASDFAATMQVDVPGSLPRTAGGLDDYLGIGTCGGGTDQTSLGPGIYGFNWWFNPAGQTWPAAPHDTVQANGHWNGEVLTVVPSLGIVAAWRGNSADPDTFAGPMNDILEILVEAVVP